jgi:hypothetical protein
MLQASVATSPVRIREEDKAHLDQLRAALTEALGAKPTQQDAVGHLIAFALRHRDLFVSEAAWKPMTKKQFAAWARGVVDDEGWEPVPPERIDDVVYGDP